MQNSHVVELRGAYFPYTWRSAHGTHIYLRPTFLEPPTLALRGNQQSTLTLLPQESSMAAPVKYDVVLYGATGFTGSMAAQYLAAHPQQPRVAFAGRNEKKIRGVIEKLTDVSKERVESIGVIIASAEDLNSIKAMVAQTKAVINMVGPYALYGGFELAKAAAEAGASYVDLTGESSVYKRIKNELHDIAKQTHADIVPSSGFDSLPFDLTTYLAVQALHKSSGGKADVDYALCGYEFKGSLSGGTVASLVEQAKVSPITSSDAYDLAPIRGRQKAEAVRLRKLPQFNKYGAFTLLAPHNTGVTNRSWGLLQEAQDPASYGADFRYLEGQVAPGMISAYIISSLMLFIAWLLNNVSYAGDLLRKAVPQGTGASMEEQLKGFANVRTLAYGKDGKSKAMATLSVKGDPGYLRTAMFISETALTLSLEKARLSKLGQQGGVLTPATAGGEVLAERLRKYGGVKIETKDVSNSTDLSKELPA